MDFITAIANAVSGFFKWVTQRDSEKNSAAVIKGQKEATVQKDLDQIKANVSKGDIDAIRKDDAN